MTLHHILLESSPSSRQDIVLEGTYKKTYQNPMHQLFHGAQSGLYLSSPFPKNGISSVYEYSFPENTDQRQQHLHVSDSRNVFMVSLSHPSSGINIYKKY